MSVSHDTLAGAIRLFSVEIYVRQEIRCVTKGDRYWGFEAFWPALNRI